MLDGFVILNVAENKKDECIVTISKTSLGFTQLTVQNFKYPKRVVLGIKRDLCQLGVAASDDGEISIPFYNEEKSRTCQISATIWKKEIVHLMPEWDLENYNYKVEGQFNKKHTEMIFDLKNAKQCNKRQRSTKKELEENNTEKETILDIPQDTSQENTPVELTEE